VGELCCDYGEHGKACAPAASCPRFCGADAECNTGQGEACLRTTLMSPQAVCTQPEAGLRLCQNDQSCGTGERCCGAYKEPVCLPTWACPEACTDSSSCNTAVGEVCCTTIGLVDSTIASPGICAGSTLCPRACAQSSDCRTDIGEVCCEGVCAASCAGRCDTSNDCVAQVCCKSPVVESPWLGSVHGPGYPGGDPPGCLHCSDAFNGPVVPEQVCGSSIAVTQALLGCMCQNCAVDCDELCGGSEYPSTYCNLCVQDYCPEETDACLADQ
jgi:hypothetical protein